MLEALLAMLLFPSSSQSGTTFRRVLASVSSLFTTSKPNLSMECCFHAGTRNAATACHWNVGPQKAPLYRQRLQSSTKSDFVTTFVARYPRFGTLLSSIQSTLPTYFQHRHTSREQAKRCFGVASLPYWPGLPRPLRKAISVATKQRPAHPRPTIGNMWDATMMARTAARPISPSESNITTQAHPKRILA